MPERSGQPGDLGQLGSFCKLQDHVHFEADAPLGIQRFPTLAGGHWLDSRWDRPTEQDADGGKQGSKNHRMTQLVPVGDGEPPPETTPTIPSIRPSAR